MELGHPVFEVGQQEVDDLVFVVVEALGIPGGVLTLTARMEELVVGAVKLVDALPGVLAGVGVNHIQKHGNAQLMGPVNEGFQLLRCAEPGGGGKEVGHLIAKGGIVGVLHNGHNLNGGVAQLFDAGQGVFHELPVGAHLSLLLGHADVALVDIEFALGLEAFIRPGICFGGVNHGVPLHRVLLLHHIVGIQGNPLQLLPFVDYHRQHLHTVLQGVLAGDEQGEHPVFQLLHGVGMAVPAAEVTGEVHGLRTRRPLPVIPSVGGLVQAKIFIAIGKVPQALSLGEQLLKLVFQPLRPQVKILLIGLQVGVILEYFVLHMYQDLSNVLVVSLSLVYSYPVSVSRERGKFPV